MKKAAVLWTAAFGSRVSPGYVTVLTSRMPTTSAPGGRWGIHMQARAAT